VIFSHKKIARVLAGIAMLGIALAMPLTASNSESYPLLRVEKEAKEAGLSCFAYRQYTELEIDMMAQMVWGEARGTTRDEQKLVVWVVLQRVMSDCGRWPDYIAGVITQNMQFHGFRPSFPIEQDLRDVVVGVLEYWSEGGEPKILYPYAPSLPYFFFRGDGTNNWFREDWKMR